MKNRPAFSILNSSTTNDVPTTSILARLGTLCVGSAVVLLLLATGCASIGSRGAGRVGVEERDAAANPNYPFSEVEGVYDAVLAGMTEKYFSAYPELDREHTQALQAFIRAEYPKDRFVQLMVRDEYRPVLERGRDEPTFRQDKKFQDAFTILINVSVPMAKMIIGGKRGIYVAKFVEKNPVKVELFSMVRSEADCEFVSWVSGEVTADTSTLELGAEHPVKPGDRVFEFCSPEETWQGLCGRSGFIIVRDGKIVDVAVTMMN